MAGEAKAQAVVKLRTYADDFARAQAATGGNVETVTQKPPITEEPPKSVKPEKVPATQSITPPRKLSSSPVPAPIEPLTQTVPENPPFHFVHDSAPAETTTAPDSKVLSNTMSAEAVSEIASISQNLNADLNKESILSTNDDIFDIHHADTGPGDGNIITDTKRRKAGLFRSIIISIQNWFQETKTNLAKQREPEHTVEAPQRRLETIQKAAQASALAPEDDHSSVTSRIATKAPAEEEVVSPVINEAPEEAPRWTHEIGEEETAEPIIESPATPETESASMSTPVATATVPEEATSEPAIPDTEPSAPLGPDTPPIESSDQNESGVEATVIPETVPVQPSEEPITTTTTDPTPEEITPTPVPTRLYRPSEDTPSGFRLLPIVLVSMVAIVLGVGVAFWLFGQKEEVAAPVFTIPSDVRVEEQLAVSLPNERESFLVALISAANNTNGVIQLYPATAVGETVRPASASESLAVLSPRAPGGFIRNIEQITYGVVEGTEPFIVLSVQSFDTALSGMLAWEPAISADLSPWFGSVVTNSFDPNARTVDQVREAFFTDTIISNRDVRVLVDETRSERIIYSFIDRNTILITTSRATFDTVLPLIQ